MGNLSKYEFRLAKGLEPLIGSDSPKGLDDYIAITCIGYNTRFSCIDSILILCAMQDGIAKPVKKSELEEIDMSEFLLC